MMKIDNVKIQLCLICPNRYLCIPESEFGLSNTMGEKFSHRDFVYIKKDDSIFKEGDIADTVFCIYHGEVTISHIDKRSNEKIRIKNATDGDIIGFNSIIDGHYINSAQTIEDTFCCCLKLSEVYKLIKEHKPIAEKILAGQ